MDKNGSQPLSLEIGSPAIGSCVYPFVAAHELIHALGRIFYIYLKLSKNNHNLKINERISS